MQGYNPNWSGLLSANAQRANAMGQLGSDIGGAIQANRQQKAQQQAQQEISQAFQSNDPNKIAQVSIKYPQMSKSIRDSLKFKDEVTEKNFLDTNFKILSDPANTEKYLTERAQFIESTGGDNRETLARLEMYKQNPDQFLKTTEGITAATSPDRYTSYKSTKPQEMTPYQQQQVDIAKQELALKKQKQGQGTAKKLLKVQKMPDESLVKVYTDGTEERMASNEPIKTSDMRKPLTINNADSILLKAPEGAKQAAGFALRINDGLDGMNALVDAGQVSPERAAFISSSLGNGMISNQALNPSEQAYLVHARDTVNAILRKDTGAAITPEEMTEYSRLYLPQPGDSKKALDAKRKKLEGRFKTFRGESGLVYEAMKVSDKAYEDSYQGGQSQQGTSQSGQPANAQAPDQAIQALRNNPSLATQFRAKYGYIPEGL